MFVLDTDMLTLLSHGHAKAQAIALTRHPRVISVITRIEILRGRFDFMMKAATEEEWLRAQMLLDRWDTTLSLYPIIPVDKPAASEFNRLRAIKSLKKIGRGDLLIASIVLAHKAILVTRNTRDFKLVPGLKFENWAD